jgi:hypothetical protein
VQEQEHKGNVENGRSATRKPLMIFEELLNAIGDSLSDCACSEVMEDGENEGDEEEDSGYGKLSEDDEPGWVTGPIFKTIQHLKESFQHPQMRLDELSQPGWRDAADYIREKDMK